MLLGIDALRLDFQPEENLISTAVDRYVADLRDGKKIAPIVVRSDGKSYWLQDGFHRVAAMKALGITDVEAEILPGTLTDMEAEWKKAVRAALDMLATDGRASG